MSPKEKITLKDIAEKAGVSVPTVSQALAGKGRIAQATKARIFQVVEELSYHPDPAAQSLARRRADKLEPGSSPQPNRKSMKQANFLEYVSNHELPLGVQIEAQQRDEEGYDVSGLRLDPRPSTRYPGRACTNCSASCSLPLTGQIIPTRSRPAWMPFTPPGLKDRAKQQR